MKLYIFSIMKNKILVQDLASRSESLRQKLNALVYQRGIDSFFTENIPFSYSRSKLIIW